MRYMLLAVVVFSCQPALATIEGTLWDPDFDGEGWTVEAQNDLAFYTWYRYESDGSPTFRTAICTITYEVVTLEDIRQTCSGELYLTTDRDNTTLLGPFSVSYRMLGGVPIGDLDANGTRRTVVPFMFNFVNEIDMLRGIWVTSEISTVDTDSTTISFDSFDSVLSDGTTPARTFETGDGLPGFAYYEPSIRQFLAVVDLLDGTLILVNFLASDDKALGSAAVTDSAFNPISETSLILASSVANTEGERAALGALLGVGKSRPTGTMHLRKVPLDRVKLPRSAVRAPR